MKYYLLNHQSFPITLGVLVRITRCYPYTSGLFPSGLLIQPASCICRPVGGPGLWPMTMQSNLTRPTTRLQIAPLTNCIHIPARMFLTILLSPQDLTELFICDCLLISPVRDSTGLKNNVIYLFFMLSPENRRLNMGTLLIYSVPNSQPFF